MIVWEEMTPLLLPSLKASLKAKAEGVALHMFCATRSCTPAGKRDHFLLTAASADAFSAAFLGNSDSVLQGTSVKCCIVEYKQVLQLLLVRHSNPAEPVKQSHRRDVEVVGPVDDLVEAVVSCLNCHDWAFDK